MDNGKLEELAKISINPIEILKHVKIQEPGSLELRYEEWGHLIKFYEALERYRLILLIKSKQIGISWALAVKALQKIYTTPGSNILMLSSGQKEAQKLLGKVRIVWNNLPDWMKQCNFDPVKYLTIEPDSTEQFGIKEMGSLITALPSTEKAGIGETSDWVIHDEADFHDFFEVNLGHTLATTADNPRRQVTVVTTVDKPRPDSYFKGLYKAAQNGLNSFHPLFYGFDVRPGRDEKWYEEQKRINESTPWVVEANYPRSVEEALSPLSAQSCFNKISLDKLWVDANEGRPHEVRQGFIYILSSPRVGVQYAAGVDVGEGVGLDYSCLTVVGRQGLNSEVVAVIYTNYLATDLFAYEIVKLCGEYFNPLLAIENNSLGIAVTNKVVELGYSNLFYGDTAKKKVGWTTGEKNKQLGLIELVQSVNDSSLTTRFKPQVKELMEYQWVNGKPTPTGKTHGDTVMSLMLANEMLKSVKGSFKPSLFIRGRQIF